MKNFSFRPSKWKQYFKIFIDGVFKQFNGLYIFLDLEKLLFKQLCSIWHTSSPYHMKIVYDIIWYLLLHEQNQKLRFSSIALRGVLFSEFFLKFQAFVPIRIGWWKPFSLTSSFLPKIFPRQIWKIFCYFIAICTLFT